MNALRAVLRFLYDFVIGDDWKIAAGVVCSLSVGAILLAAGAGTTVVAIATAVVVAASFTTALLIDVRRADRR